jgi:hypothetical protein
MSQAVPSLLFGVAGFAAQQLGLFKKPKTPPMPPPITRNEAAAQASTDRTFRQRIGAGANEITRGGAEAATGGGKTLLGQ